MSTSLVECRYNKNHKVKSSRLLFHEKDCPDRFKVKLSICSYDSSHKVKPSELEKHEKNCPRRPKHDNDLLKEMEEYIENQSKIRNQINIANNTNVISDNSINSTNKTNARTIINEEVKENNDKVVGLRNNYNKRKIKNEEKSLKKLIDQDDINEDYENIDVTYPDHHNQMDIKSIEEEKKFESFLNNRKGKQGLIVDEYNPNDSQLFNRNNLNMNDSDEEKEDCSFNNDDDDMDQSNNNQSKNYNEFDSDFITSFHKSREGGR